MANKTAHRASHTRTQTYVQLSLAQNSIRVSVASRWQFLRMRRIYTYYYGYAK